LKKCKQAGPQNNSIQPEFSAGALEQGKFPFPVTQITYKGKGVRTQDSSVQHAGCQIMLRWISSSSTEKGVLLILGFKKKRGIYLSFCSFS